MKHVVCQSCGKSFLIAVLIKNPTCYTCSLDKIAGENPPEEGDFNTALIVSGEMSKDDWKLLQKDLLAVEQGISGDTFFETRFSDDPNWCYRCNNDIDFCRCYEDNDDNEESGI